MRRICAGIITGVLMGGILAGCSNQPTESSSQTSQVSETTSASQSALEKTTLKEEDRLQDVFLKAKESSYSVSDERFLFLLDNQREEDIQFSPGDYELEIEQDGEWYRIPGKLRWESVCGVYGNTETEMLISQNEWPSYHFTPGHYRLILVLLDGTWAAAEFDLL